MSRDVELKEVECLRCGWTWTPRVPEVRTCARCRSVWWDTPPKENKSKVERR